MKRDKKKQDEYYSVHEAKEIGACYLLYSWGCKGEMVLTSKGFISLRRWLNEEAQRIGMNRNRIACLVKDNRGRITLAVDRVA